MLLQETAKLQLELSEQKNIDELRDVALSFTGKIYNFFMKHFTAHDCKLCRHCVSNS